MGTNYEGKQKKDVLLNVPNIIGYVRVLLFLFGIWRALEDDYVVAVSLYIIHWALDCADGIVARSFNQCSKFGAVFDWALDLALMTMWKAVLCVLYPKYAFFIMMQAAYYIFGDVLLFSSLDARDRQVTPDDVGSYILKKYYEYSYFREVMIVGDWIFWLLLYIVNYTHGPIVPVFNVGIWTALLCLHVPFLLFRVVILNSATVCSSANILVSIDISKELKSGHVQ